jgi:hypothetical protein
MEKVCFVSQGATQSNGGENQAVHLAVVMELKKINFVGSIKNIQE